jgi:hypothetical protein
MRRAIAIGLCAAALAACTQRADNSDAPEGWLAVLGHKRKAVTSNSPNAKQGYADALSAFAKAHPRHSRAREVYMRIQLDFARDLTAIGRHQDAIYFCRAVLKKDPANVEAQRLMNKAIDRLSVTHQKLLALRKGMTQKEVASILGKPAPGWSVSIAREDSVTESWYYRHRDGGVASVHFLNGRLFAADERSEARLALLSAGAVN